MKQIDCMLYAYLPAKVYIGEILFKSFPMLSFFFFFALKIHWNFWEDFQLLIPYYSNKSKTIPPELKETFFFFNFKALVENDIKTINN